MTTRDQTPTRLGPYRLLERLGEGGMGVVYLATDSEQRKVAVKALRPAVAADPNARRRLAREVETMRRVRSPFVAEVTDADVDSDPPYIVTRYVRGETLDEIVTRGGPLTGEKLARLASGLALALTAVHSAGVVHRDLKPGNVMISHGEPVVIDFGIAQVPDSTRLTQTGMFMGTPGYLAPEVIEGRPSGTPSDVHSWGATVAFAATARPPYGSGAFETIFYRIINGQPDLGGFPVPLLDLVTRALSRDPSRRPTAAELCLRTAALDPATLLPAPPAPMGPPRREVAAGTMADRPAPVALAGAATAAPPAAGNGAGPPGVAAGQAPQDFRGALPPVRYAPPPPSQPPPSRRGDAVARGATRSPAGSLLVAASVAAAVGLSVVFPVAGTVAALAVLIALRAGGRTGERLLRKRSRRGAKAGDLVLALFMFPSSVAWAALRSVLLLPLALAAAAAAAIITLAVVQADPVAAACAYAAGVLVAFYGLGPGSSGSRRPMRKFFDAVAFTPLSAAIAFGAVSVVVVGAIVVAASHPPFFWPVGHLPGWLQHFDWLNRLGRYLRSQALRPRLRWTTGPRLPG
jgi:predicted Ser/Thr protein kinase